MFAVQGEGVLTSKLAMRVNRLQKLIEVGGIDFTDAVMKVKHTVICALPSLFPLYGWAAGICITKVLQQESQHSLLSLVPKKQKKKKKSIFFYNKDTAKRLYISIDITCIQLKCQERIKCSAQRPPGAQVDHCKSMVLHCI